MSDEKFTPSEPGISHPLTRCAVRLTDDGRTVIMAGDLAGIIIDETTGVVSVYGTEVRFITPSVKINGRKIAEGLLESHSGPAAIGRQLRRIEQKKGSAE